jgi:hypothetical protein
MNYCMQTQQENPQKVICVVNEDFNERINKCLNLNELMAEIKIIGRIISGIDNIDECLELIDRLNISQARMMNLLNQQKPSTG